MHANSWIMLGAILGGLAVAAGAFAAHGLDHYFEVKYADDEPRSVAGVKIPAAQKYLTDFKTAAEYQMYHALALLGVGLLARTPSSIWLTVAGWSFVVGIVIFSGCLYALTLTGQRWLGAFVPIGGVSFLIGWTALAIGAASIGKQSSPSAHR